VNGRGSIRCCRRGCTWADFRRTTGPSSTRCSGWQGPGRRGAICRSATARGGPFAVKRRGPGVDIDLRSEIDGIAIARLLHDRHGTTSVFLTGQLEAVRSARDAAAGLIPKPYNFGAVVRAVDAVAQIRLGQLPETMPPQLEVFG
jgi:hypothetical protein